MFLVLGPLCLPILKLLLDGNNAVAHLTTNAYRPQRGVYVEGEVQHRSALGELTYVTGGCEDEYLTRGRL